MSRTNMQKLSKVLHRALSNISQGMTDKYIERNALFRYESGMQPKIIRKSSGHCCEWCNKVAGTYSYPDVPKDVYRRHDNCDCTVEYMCGKQRTNIHTKAKRVITVDSKVSDGHDTRKMINESIEDVTHKYIKDATPNKGQIVIEERTEADDVEIVQMIHSAFGGDIRCLEEKPHIGNMPDSLWREKYWEFKRPTTINAVDARIRKAQEQLFNASNRDGIEIGGMVIDISRANCNKEDIIEEIIVRVKSRCKNDQDVIISRDGKVLLILRYRTKG